jgi:hypothetical protein
MSRGALRELLAAPYLELAMQTLSPSVDRIGAALKALRRAHESDDPGNDPVALGAKCLQAVVAQLTDEGVPPQDLQPLTDLEARVRQFMVQTQGPSVTNRRKQLPPSDVLLARGAAVIDLLIKAGADEGEAAQTVMRRLMAAGVPPPTKGGDARGWRRLLEWRTSLIHGLVSGEAQQEYRDFTREIDTIPADERVRKVIDEQLWDRRRKSR